MGLVFVRPTGGDQIAVGGGGPRKLEHSSLVFNPFLSGQSKKFSLI